MDRVKTKSLKKKKKAELGKEKGRKEGKSRKNEKEGPEIEKKIPHSQNTSGPAESNSICLNV